MTKEEIELSDDEITKALNKRLNEDAKQEKLEKAVDKKLEEQKKVETREKKEQEVHEATFTDETDKKKKKVKTKGKIECATCGSEDMVKISNDEDTYFYKGTDISEVYKCNDCGRRSGIPNE